MISRRFEDITKADVDSLVADKVAESKTLDYKREMIGRKSSEKKEFLADISSFANASGGDMVVGIEEGKGKRKGVAVAVVPIKSESADEAKLRLEQIIRNGIKPHLNVQIREISGFGEEGTGFIILIRIPQSIAAPHMVTLEGSSKFYSRGSAGKLPLEVDEIREAFLANEYAEQRIRSFVQERLGKNAADEVPIQLPTSRRLILHMVPFRQVGRDQRIQPIAMAQNSSDIWPIDASGASRRYNLDGFLIYSSDGRTGARSYVQLFRSGAIEAVTADIVSHFGPGPDDRPFLPSLNYELYIIEAVKTYWGYLKKMEVGVSVVVFLSLLGFKGVELGTGTRGSHSEMIKIETENLILPEVFIADIASVGPEDTTHLLQPLFDSLWNIFGYARSLNYDKDGNWNPR